VRGKESVVVDAHGELHSRFLHLALRLQIAHVGLALGGVVLQVPSEGGREEGWDEQVSMTVLVQIKLQGG